MNALNPVTFLEGVPITTLSVFDRAFQYGDGFFTTILIAENAILNWPSHWRRLEQSASRLQFNALNESLLLQQIEQAVLVFNQSLIDTPSTSKIVKILVSRGVSEQTRGYAFSKNVPPLVFVQVSAVASANNSPPPIEIECCQTQASIQAQLAGLKHLNRLDNVLARTEVEQKQQQEGVMLNALGYVIGGTQSNLFMIKGNQLMTPKLNLSGVEGTTRYQLSQLLASKWKTLELSWQEADITLVQLLEADELFLSNAVRGISPIKRLDSNEFMVDKTLKIQKKWNDFQTKNALILREVK